jgi:hypothetical protein
LVNPTPVIATVLGDGLVTLMVIVVVPLSAKFVAANETEAVGASHTVRVRVVVLLKTLDVTAVMLCGVFWYTPAVILLTGTNKKQLIPATIDTPVTVMVPPSTGAVTVPPPQLLLDAPATTRPVGKVLVKPTPV